MDNGRREVAAIGVVIAMSAILLPLPHVKNGSVRQNIVQNENLQSNTNPTNQSDTIVNHKTVTVQYYDVPLNHELQDYIKQLCGQYNVSEQLALAVMKQESEFDPNAISDAGAEGLFQINPINFDLLHKTLGVTNLFDPFQNSLCGIWMLGQLKQKYDTENEALIAYNNGESSANRLISRGITQTTYTDEVQYKKGQLQEVFVEINAAE